jgi:uroporphyrinogen-III synthase
MRPLLVLRPEPGASATAARARALGLDPIVCPLFAIEPVAWPAPDPARFDALLLTSANALRHGGAGLAALTDLPVLAVGETTAAAARDAGFTVAQVGTAGITELLAALPGRQKLLHLAGEDRIDSGEAQAIAAVVAYRAVPLAPSLPTDGAVALVHSPRAGARLADLVSDRATTAIAALSEACALACGPGWQRVDWPDSPSDSALLALAARLCQSPPQ